MEAIELKRHIKDNTIPSFLIFTGEEWKVQEEFIKHIVKVSEKNKTYIDSIADVYSALRNTSFVKTSHVYVARDDKPFMESEKLQNQVRNGLLGDNIYIMLLTNVDKRTKFYKQYQKDIIVFEHLTDMVLKKHILKHVNLSEKNCEKLIDICEKDYGRILLEIDKINTYGRSMMKYGEDMVFEILVKDGTIYEPPYDAIFDLVDAILDRKVNVAYNLLNQSYAVGEATLVMLSVLYNNAKAVLQVQSCKSDNISKSTGLTGWQIKNAQKHTGKYKTSELVNMLKLVYRVQNGIKTGEMEENIAMDYVLTSIL